MKLPTKKTAASTDLRRISILAFGRGKSGKSTLAAGIGRGIFLATERGLDHIDCFRIPDPSKKAFFDTWAELLAARDLLQAGKHDFDSIVIDTIDNAYQYCQAYICKKHRIEHPADLSYGKGFALVNNEFKGWVNSLARLPMGLILISHSRTIETENKGKKRAMTCPTLPTKAREFITGLVDIILYCEVIIDKSGKRQHVCRAAPSPDYFAGDRTGLLPPVFPLSSTEFLSYFKKKGK